MAPAQAPRCAVFGVGHLGRVMVERFRAADYSVVAIGRRLAQDFGEGVARLAADLGTPQGVRAVCERIAEEPLEALLVTAGAFAAGPLVEETAEDEFEELLWVNARLPFYILKGLLPALRAAKGHAVLIGAMGAQEARARQVSYNASKAALHSIVQTCAQELKGTGATVNALLPLTIDTAANRAAMPDRDPALWVSPARLAELALLLCSDAGRDVNGALLPVRGAG